MLLPPLRWRFRYATRGYAMSLMRFRFSYARLFSPCYAYATAIFFRYFHADVIRYAADAAIAAAAFATADAAYAAAAATLHISPCC